MFYFFPFFLNKINYGIYPPLFTNEYIHFTLLVNSQPIISYINNINNRTLNCKKICKTITK